MLKSVAATTLAASLAFSAIAASETQKHTDVNRAVKGDRMPLPQTKPDVQELSGHTTNSVSPQKQPAGNSVKATPRITIVV